MHTGENEQGLKKVMDLTRLIAIVVLLLHFYYECYRVFVDSHLTSEISDQLLKNIVKTGLLQNSAKTKLVALGFLLLSVLGIKGKKSEKLQYKTACFRIVAGSFFYFSTKLLFDIEQLNIEAIATAYMLFTGLGFILIMTGAGLLTRIIKHKLNPDVFNKANETFPQEERILRNEHSINLRAQYYLKGKKRNSWINIINPMRGLLVVGSPGSGKSFFVVEHVIRQHIEKGFAMFIYDYKYDDLTRLAYNHLLKHLDKYPIRPAFYVINFDEPSFSHRCNPLDPKNMHDITDAVEAARVILLGLNRSWIKRQGDFFVESPINFLIALIWFLRKYEDGVYCTLPHVIELMQVDFEKLFRILKTESEIEAYISPFISAMATNSLEQLEGQLDAAKISLARLSSPALYYTLSGNEFTLDINNPKAPKIISLANNPQKQEVYGPVLSLYMTRMTRIINRKQQQKCSLVIDEFATLTFLGFDTLIATGRSNKIATTLAIQDASQLRMNYGRELADVIVNICGNIIVGQVGGELAKQVSERLGKTLQERESISINSSDTSVSRSKQLEVAVPVSTISALSSGEFVGMVADNPDEPIALKTFHAKVVNDKNLLHKQKQSFVALPQVRKVDQKTIHDNYEIIRQDIRQLVEIVMNQVLNDPLQ
ncbi:MAG: conjugal transfer protein MobC [Bacteroidota bacterium]